MTEEATGQGELIASGLPKGRFQTASFFYYFKIEDHLLDFKIKIPRQANY